MRMPALFRVAVVGSAVLSTTLASAPASAAPPAAPALRLASTTSAVTYERFGPGEPVFFLDLGTHIVAGDTAFEIRATRASYADPVVARQVSRRGNRETLRTLPAGLITDLTGLTGFLHLTLTDAAGATVADMTPDFCPGSFGAAVRSRPDAPSTSPYPERCASTPFALSGVWGLQAGWSVPTFLDFFDAGPLDIPDGTYTARISIAEKYRAAFDIPANQSSATIAVTVRTFDPTDPNRPPSPEAARQAAVARAATRMAVPAAGGATPRTAGTAAGQRLTPAATRPRATAAPPRTPRPDLRAVPAFDVVVDNGTPDGDFLMFAANVWNAGPSPLVVDGFRREGTDVMDAFQYFYDARGRQVGSAPTGTFEFDHRDGHDHWHFTDFATYRLLDASRQVAVRSQKEAFCLAPTDPIDLLVPAAEWKPRSTGLSTACGGQTALSIREALDTGWGDTYFQSLPGQSFDLNGVPNGTYYIEVAANPENRLFESSTTNNTSLRKVILGGSPGARTVQVPAVGLVDAP